MAVKFSDLAAASKAATLALSAAYNDEAKTRADVVAALKGRDQNIAALANADGSVSIYKLANDTSYTVSTISGDFDVPDPADAGSEPGPDAGPSSGDAPLAA